MVFEIGKYYRHTTGVELSIVGEVETTMFGKCLIAEHTQGTSLKPIGRDEAAAVNFVEITKDEWMKNFCD